MSTKRKNKHYEESPLTMEEVLQRDNVPASEPVPVEIAERLASKYSLCRHFRHTKNYWGKYSNAPVRNLGRGR